MATVNIYVSLDINANPQVELTQLGGGSARSQSASGGDTIRWQKKDNNDQFNITSLTPTGSNQAFATPATGGGGQWLSSVFQPDCSSQTDEFPYTLTVTKGAVTYNTTKVSAELEDDRPVIRN